MRFAPDLPITRPTTLDGTLTCASTHFDDEADDTAVEAIGRGGGAAAAECRGWGREVGTQDSKEEGRCD